MAIVQPNVLNDGFSVNPSLEHLADQQPPSTDEPRTQCLHRIREVRLQQGVSLRSAARHTGRDVRTLRQQEQADSDLKLSDLLKWQQALDVPLSDLLEEGDEPLSRPVMERARLIRLMKTAAAIHERSEALAIRRMAQMLVEQLIEIMPELEEVSPWHNYGQRRGLDEMGQVFEHQVSDETFGGWD